MGTTRLSAAGPSEMIGRRLRKERNRLGLSQVKFAEIACVGSLAQLHYEAGKRSPDALYLFRVAAAGVDVNYVITGYPVAPGGWRT